jgi:putative DNA primase/helicase
METKASSGSSSAKADFKPQFHLLRLDESANVHRYVELFRGRYMFVPGMGWYVWTGNHWREDVLGQAFSDTQSVARVLDMEWDEFEKSPAGAALEEEDLEKRRRALYAFRTKTLGIRARQAMLAGAEVELGVVAEDLNSDRWSLVVSNGTLDLRSGVLRDSVPADLNTQSASVVYEEDALCPRFDEFLKFAFDGSEEMISYIWRVLGYTLTGSTAEQNFFFLWGVRGSGKSTICEIMTQVMGDYALKMDEESLFGANQHPTWIADLLGKRMLWKDELNQKRRMNTALVNTMVSGGTMKGRRMRKDFANIRLDGKLFISTNHRPPMGNAQDGVFRRLKPVWFGNAVMEAEKVLDFAAELVQEEGAGILRKALEGLADYLAGAEGTGVKPSLRTPAQVIKDAQDYQDSEDELGPFVTDHLVKTGDEKDWVCNEDLYALYRTWCEGGGTKPMAQTELSKHLKEMGFVPAPPRKAKDLTGKKMTKRGFAGMRLDVEDGAAVIMWRPVV